jgi:glycosyltransferase involved in cell wall biosynthesis
MISFLFIDTERVWRGGQAQLFTLIRGLEQRGHRVHLICYPKTLLGERASKEGIHVHPLAFRSEIGLISLFRIAALIRAIKPEILGFNTPKPILIGNLASRFTSVHARIIFRRVNFPLRKGLMTRLKYNWGIDSIIAISESIKAQLQADGVAPARISTIYEGLDLEGCEPRRTPIAKEPGEPLLLGTVAHLSLEKGLTYLIEAAALIPEVQSRMRFVIVGDGRCRKELEGQVRARNLAQCFRFEGFQEQTIQYFESFDIFVLPSLSEGLSSSILTAMAMGLPVIATKVGGIPELISDGENGLLVRPADSVGLAEAIRRLAAHPEERFRMGQMGRARMEKQFTLQRKIDDTERLCESFLKRPASGSRLSHV